MQKRSQFRIALLKVLRSSYNSKLVFLVLKRMNFMVIKATSLFYCLRAQGSKNTTKMFWKHNKVRNPLPANQTLRLCKMLPTKVLQNQPT